MYSREVGRRIRPTCEVLFLVIWALVICIGCQGEKTEYVQITKGDLRNKIAGGWAGKIIGVAFGGPTEFQYNGIINEDEIAWDPASVRDAIWQDDLYVQMTFMMTMDEYGIDAPAEKFAKDFADAGYMLFHANRKARKNVWDGIIPPLSGHPQYNLHADDLDFQIEADFIGFMNPGMPRSANTLCDRIGHIMNYGDGVYGGMFVSALYAAAYLESDIETIVRTALASIPSESEYAQVIADVLEGYKSDPTDWRAGWHTLQDKWGTVDICGALDPFSIDAKLNGAYIAMGLLYGGGNFGKTMEISTRCGQDSDCNPSNAAGVLGIILGYEQIPEIWKRDIPVMADQTFIHTSYSFNSVVDRTLDYALELIQRYGGYVKDDICHIQVQSPEPPELEVSFPDLKAAYRTTVQDDAAWEWNGNWQEVVHRQWGSSETQRIADEEGSAFVFSFSGAGAVIMGRWDRDGGKADVYVDGEYVREIDNYYWVAETGAGFQWLNSAHLFHVLDLAPGQHTIRMVVNGKKNEKSTGTKMRVSRAIVYN